MATPSFQTVFLNVKKKAIGTGRDIMEWIHLAQIWDQWQLTEKSN
jgi:hypothetical protein